MRHKLALLLVPILVFSPCGIALAAEVREVLPLTDRIVMLHFSEGYVVHHAAGQSRSEEKVVISALDAQAASSPAAYAIQSTEDERYRAARAPVQVGRKSKGTDFAWFADKWENGRAVNTRPDHTKEHWIYLFLPEAMSRGKTYRVATGPLASNGKEFIVAFDESKCRSEAVHVNLLGYVPSAAQKFGYVYHWLGDKGGLDLKSFDSAAFEIIEAGTGKAVFAGKLRPRTPGTQQETFHKTDSPPDGNFVKADVYECDFSAFTATASS